MQHELYWFIVAKILLTSWIRLLVHLYEPEQQYITIISMDLEAERKRRDYHEAEHKQDCGKDQDFSPKPLFFYSYSY